jgi:hypothetical protein
MGHRFGMFMFGMLVSAVSAAPLGPLDGPLDGMRALCPNDCLAAWNACAAF